MKTLIYKLYVLALLGLVIWAAQFMYPLIFWEVEYTGVDKKLNLRKNEDEMVRMRKIRNYIDKHTRERIRDLGDIVIREHYEKGHFHHPGQTLVPPVLNGCDYCHTILPHRKDLEARAFRNMHGYFVSCETCHFSVRLRPNQVEHGWIKLKTEEKTEHPLTKIKLQLADKKELKKAKGNYGARIAPWVRRNGKLVSIVGRSSRKKAQSLLKKFDTLPDSEVKSILKSMHKGLTKRPLKCDGCHTKKNSAISYKKLGYRKKAAIKLKDAAVAGLISKYDKFHFPNLFIRKDDRQRDQDQTREDRERDSGL